MMWHAADGMGWWMLWGGLMMVVFWGAIIGLIVWGIHAFIRREAVQTVLAQPSSPGRNPLEIAKERYAGGEIGHDEFAQLRAYLEDQGDEMSAPDHVWERQ